MTRSTRLTITLWCIEELAELFFSTDERETDDALLDLAGIVLHALAERSGSVGSAFDAYNQSQIERGRLVDVTHVHALRAAIAVITAGGHTTPDIFGERVASAKGAQFQRDFGGDGRLRDDLLGLLYAVRALKQGVKHRSSLEKG